MCFHEVYLLAGINGEHKKERGYFLAIPVVKTSPSSEKGAGSTSGQRTKISSALWPKNTIVRQIQ